MASIVAKLGPRPTGSIPPIPKDCGAIRGITTPDFRGFASLVLMIDRGGPRLPRRPNRGWLRSGKQDIPATIPVTIPVTIPAKLRLAGRLWP